MVDWQYQKDDAPARAAVVDFTPLLADSACPTCGAEAYIEAFATGHMRIRWRCEHSSWADEDDEGE